jgi:translation elongation factor EF-4
MKFLTPTRGSIIYDIPLAEVITDFFDQVRSAVSDHDINTTHCHNYSARVHASVHQALLTSNANTELEVDARTDTL